MQSPKTKVAKLMLRCLQKAKNGGGDVQHSQPFTDLLNSADFWRFLLTLLEHDCSIGETEELIDDDP